MTLHLLLACATAPTAVPGPHPATLPAFSCHGEPEEAPGFEGRLMPDVAPGAPRVTLLSPALPTLEPNPTASMAESMAAARAAYGPVEITVAAELSTLDALATQLAAATGLNVTVHPELLGARVTLAMPVTTIRGLEGALAAYDVAIGYHTSGLSLQPVYVWWQNHTALTHTGPEEQEVQLLVLPVPPSVDGVALATLYCGDLASPRGRVVVSGGQWVVYDAPPHLARFRELVHVMEGLEQGELSDAP